MTLTHGWQPCRICHPAGNDFLVKDEWHLRANPGYWGAAEPRVLVLGFSKGATQVAAATGREFDRVAFAGMRPRLEQVLQALNLDLAGQSIDRALTADGHQFGAASIIRCGLSLERDGKLITSGTIMPKAARADFTRQVMKNCIRQHLRSLPSSVETIVLLGTTDAYINGLKNLMREQFSDFREINEVAFTARGRTWVFAAHPSPANGTFKRWLSDNSASPPGRKRMLALRALAGDPPELAHTAATQRPRCSCHSRRASS